jgi:hypothetical protein
MNSNYSSELSEIKPTIPAHKIIWDTTNGITSSKKSSPKTISQASKKESSGETAAAIRDQSSNAPTWDSGGNTIAANLLQPTFMADNTATRVIAKVGKKKK